VTTCGQCPYHFSKQEATFSYWDGQHLFGPNRLRGFRVRELSVRYARWGSRQADPGIMGVANQAAIAGVHGRHNLTDPLQLVGSTFRQLTSGTL
jgi:hypothetical protein